MTLIEPVRPDVSAWPAPPPGARRPAPRTRRSRLALVAGTAAALASAVWLGNAAAVIGTALLFALSWPLERLWRRHPVPVRRFGVRTDLAYAVLTPALQAVGFAAGYVVGVLSLAWLPALTLRPLVETLPGAVRTLLGVVLFDLVIYWTHRLSHTVALFWRFHAIHHSSIHLDWVSGFRNHPLDGVFIAPAAALLVGAGFDGAFVGVLAVLQFVVGLWAHLNVRWRLRPLHRVILTPDFHHWHHANEPESHNKNFSVLLPAWDLLFGTYYMPAARRPMRYGVDMAVPDGLVGQLLAPVRGLRLRRRRRTSATG